MGSTRKRIDLAGQKFGRLVVVSEAPARDKPRRRWNCRCECGCELVVRQGALTSGNTSSCGCIHREMLRERNTSHGMSKSRVYNIWCLMLARCNSPRASKYSRYGGRGIKVCERWLSFQNFLDDMGQPPTDRHTIDRTNNDGDYEPTNTRWTTYTEQANNRSNNVLLTLNGQTHTP